MRSVHRPSRAVLKREDFDKRVVIADAIEHKVITDNEPADLETMRSGFRFRDRPLSGPVFQTIDRAQQGMQLGGLCFRGDPFVSKISKLGVDRIDDGLGVDDAVFHQSSGMPCLAARS